MEDKLMENIKNVAPPVSIKVKINGLAPADFSMSDDIDEYGVFSEEIAPKDFIWTKNCNCVGNCIHEINQFISSYGQE